MATLVNSGIGVIPTSELPRKMAIAVSAWLDYNSSVCGEIGVQENMINYPIKAFSIMHQNDYDFQFEKQHPYLSPRCHVDLYMKLKGNNEDEYFFEFKQAKQDTYGSNERDRIFFDIARLSSLVSESRRCFFLVFGTGTSFKKNFLEYRQKEERVGKKRFIEAHDNKKGEFTDVPFYSRWFYMSESDILKEKEINIQSDEHYEKFKAKYLNVEGVQDLKQATPPNTIITKLICLSLHENSLNGLGLWEIKVKQ